jgi:hypothetical protein
MAAPSIVGGYTQNGNAANSTTLVINTPTHANGDVIFVVYVTDGDSATASISGGGWNVLEGPQNVPTSVLPTAGVFYTWYKTASGEGASYTITSTVSERSVAVAFAVTGAGGIDAEATFSSGTDSSAEVGAVVSTVADTLRISVVVSTGVRTVSTLAGSHNLLATHSYTSAGTVSVQYKTLASSGSDAGQTATLDGTGWAAHAWAIAPSGSGTTYPSTPSGSITPSAAVTRRTGKTAAGTVTPGGALKRSVSKIVAGTLALAGTLAGVKIIVYLQSVGGALTPTGTVTRRTVKIVAGALTPAGTLAKRIAKSFAGAITAAGALVTSWFNFDQADVTLTDAAVTLLTLADAAVTVLTLADASVTALTLADSAVSTLSLADASVSSLVLTDGTT